MENLFARYCYEIEEHVASVDKQEFVDLFSDDNFLVAQISKFRKNFQEICTINLIDLEVAACLAYCHAYKSTKLNQTNYNKSGQARKKFPKKDLLIPLSFPWLVGW